MTAVVCGLLQTLSRRLSRLSQGTLFVTRLSLRYLAPESSVGPKDAKQFFSYRSTNFDEIKRSRVLQTFIAS
jgi:hypothetical protein